MGGAKGVYVDWIRMARAADGSPHYLDHRRRIAAFRSRSRVPACGCRRGCWRRLTRDEPGRESRRLALRDNARLMREEQPAGGFPREKRSSTRGGGGVDLAHFRRHGLFGSSQHGDDDRSTITGWLPDGVATVEMTFPGRVSRGPHRPATVFGDDLHVTAKVQDNVLSARVDRPAPNAIPPLMIWRAADGSVVRVVRGPR